MLLASFSTSQEVTSSLSRNSQLLCKAKDFDPVQSMLMLTQYIHLHQAMNQVVSWLQPLEQTLVMTRPQADQTAIAQNRNSPPMA